MHIFLIMAIISIIVVFIGIFLALSIESIRKSALKSGALIGCAGVAMVLLSVFKKDPPKNDRRIELIERSKKDF